MNLYEFAQYFLRGKNSFHLLTLAPASHPQMQILSFLQILQHNIFVIIIIYTLSPLFVNARSWAQLAQRSKEENYFYEFMLIAR